MQHDPNISKASSIVINGTSGFDIYKESGRFSNGFPPMGYNPMDDKGKAQLEMDDDSGYNMGTPHLGTPLLSVKAGHLSRSAGCHCQPRELSEILLLGPMGPN